MTPEDKQTVIKWLDRQIVNSSRSVLRHVEVAASDIYFHRGEVAALKDVKSYMRRFGQPRDKKQAIKP